MNLVDTLVEITLKNENDFLKIKETLTRIGVISRKDKKLFQSCHILHKKGKYYIVHFKELFALDGKSTDFSEEDKGRRNTITSLLEEWGLLDVVDKSKIEAPRTPMNQIKVIPFREKSEWTLEQKYSIGSKRKTQE
jgi:hypothetical protein